MVAAAVSQDGGVLHHASEECQADPQIVEQATEKDEVEVLYKDSLEFHKWT